MERNPFEPVQMLLGDVLSFCFATDFTEMQSDLFAVLCP